MPRRRARIFLRTQVPIPLKPISVTAVAAFLKAVR
jgi:hypothetical protein